MLDIGLSELADGDRQAALDRLEQARRLAARLGITDPTGPPHAER